jgi:uncharacterized integral membrane protein (TIGR00697 family)
MLAERTKHIVAAQGDRRFHCAEPATPSQTTMMSDHSEPSPTSPAQNGALVIVLVVGYVFIQVAANLTVLKTVSIVGDYAIPAGSLLFALSFTWLDLINEKLGNRRAHVLVVTTVFASLLLILWFELYLALPGSADWRANPSSERAVELVLGSVPRIVIASLLTNLIVENLDVAVYHVLRRRHASVPIWGRSALSNTVSAPLDGMLFPLLAFWGTLPWSVLSRIMITSAVYKLVVAYVSVPLIYTVRRRHRRTRAEEPSLR